MGQTTVLGLVLPGLATGLGGLPLLWVRHPGDRLHAGLVGFTAGIMLAASAFSLLGPALERGRVAYVVLGLLVGAATIAVLDDLLPHEHLRFAEGSLEAGRSGRPLLLLGALTVHNVPEGLAVGVAFGAGGSELGLPVALAIGIQNVPEGFAAAAPLVRYGLSGTRLVGIAAATGLVEIPAAFVGYGVVDASAAVLPFALAFAAGAMIYVVVDELVPESHAGGRERVATAGAVAGFALMMLLDNAFG